MAAHPEDLPADVSDPLLFQGVSLGVLDQIGDRAGAAELHDQLWDKHNQPSTPRHFQK